MDDPFPNQVLLSQKEVLTVLGMSRNTFREFMQDANNGFPGPIMMGTERNGKPRFRWRKYEVMSYLLLQPKPSAEKIQSQSASKRVNPRE